jgi:ABC-type branched-subunit amino acid transport system substrate-binding protein
MMQTSIPARSRFAAFATAVAVTLGLAACSELSTAFPPLAGAGSNAQPQAPDSPARGPVTGNTIGNGPTRVALILPLSSANGAAPARAMRNAAEMAIAEFDSRDLTIMVKDDKGTAEGAQAAAREALSEGAEAIIGPLFAPTVTAVAGVARPASKPVIAFSTDATVASRGVYLLSFMPRSDVRRIIAYAGSRGKKSFAALIPNSPYGNVAEQEFGNAVSAAGARVVTIVRYDANPASVQAAVSKLKGSISQADALFLPDDGGGLGLLGPALTSAGINSRSVQFLGTGVWNEPRVFSVPAMAGGWFSAPEAGGYQNFAQRYRQRYNADPTRIATLAYDATALVAAVTRTQGSQRFAEQTLTNVSGFSGQDGVFRFRQDGTNDRALAIYQVGNGGASILQPAPKSFGSGT